MQHTPEKPCGDNVRNPLSVKAERLIRLIDGSRDPELQRVARVYLLLLRGYGAGSREMRMFGVETEHDLTHAIEEVARQLEGGHGVDARGEGGNGHMV